MRKKIKFGVCILVLLMIQPAASQYLVGETVSDFTVGDLDGVPVSLNDHQGKIIFLNFFATW